MALVAWGTYSAQISIISYTISFNYNGILITRQRARLFNRPFCPSAVHFWEGIGSRQTQIVAPLAIISAIKIIRICSEGDHQAETPTLPK